MTVGLPQIGPIQGQSLLHSPWDGAPALRMDPEDAADRWAGGR